MPTSSIHHTVRIDTEDGAERLLKAIERSREAAGHFPYADVEAKDATEQEVRCLMPQSSPEES